MKILSPFAFVATALVGFVAGSNTPSLRRLANNNIWAGANSYFLHNFQDNDRRQVLDAMRDANLQVVRIFLSQVDYDNKGSGCNGVNDVEVGTPGNWDDTILNRVDQLMVEVHERGMKLIITLHDRWMLGHWGSDAYVSKYGLQGDDIPQFYTNANAAADMDRRFAHIMTHKNPHFGNRPWGDIGEAIFSVGIENESQGAVSTLNFKWVCNRAAALRQYILKPTILVGSGGGRELDTSVHPDLMNCAAIDILGVHYYGAGDDDVRNTILDAIAQNKKRIYVEEFGSTGDNKAGDLRRQIQTVKNMGVPWMFWQVSKPGKGASDFEVWTDEPAWQTISSEAWSPTQQLQPWPELGRDGTVSPPSTTPPTPGTGLGDWEFCSVNAQCRNGCCSKEYSNDGKLKCTPGGTPSQCVGGGGSVTTPPPPSTTKPTTGLGDWEFCSANYQCKNGCCSKQYSNDGKLKCTPGGSSGQCVGGSSTPPPSSGFGDWEFCSSSKQCKNSCCSKQYSDDNKLKCTPGGSRDQCV